MQALTVQSVAASTPRWLTAVAAVGILWNVVGVFQYAGTFTQAGQAAMTAAMTDAEAAVYLSLRGWVSVVFAIGVFGGLAGSSALWMRRRLARPLFLAPLLGYEMLFAADAHHGVFAAILSQGVVWGSWF